MPIHNLSLKNKEIELIQETWKLITPRIRETASILYERLFELDSSLKVMFMEGLDGQENKLMKMLGHAVDSLANLKELIPLLQNLGKSHVGYGVKIKDYTMVGAALLYTFEKVLGDAYTFEVNAAWTKLYMVIAEIMQEAAATINLK